MSDLLRQAVSLSLLEKCVVAGVGILIIHAAFRALEQTLLRRFGLTALNAPLSSRGFFQLRENQEDVGRGGGDRKQEQKEFQGLTRNANEH